MTISVLLVYDGRGPQIEALASAIAEGISRVKGAGALKRRVDEATGEDLIKADGIILGSPN